MRRDFKDVALSRHAEVAIEQVHAQLERIHRGNPRGWNFYSNALRREVVATFDAAAMEVSRSFSTVDYLEIGSAQGCSMGVMAELIRGRSTIGQLVSIDPYLPEGYVEFNSDVFANLHVPMDKTSRDYARALYEALRLSVNLLEMPSTLGLLRLLRDDKRPQFSFAYIDGRHDGLNPLLDFALTHELVVPGGVIMLDDHSWDDVNPIKRLCDRHCRKIHESWKVAAYVRP